MKQLLQLEELMQFVFGILLFSQLEYAWWIFLILILVPDIGMLGYVINKKIGAFTHNLFHHKAITIGICSFGMYFDNSTLMLVGIMLFSYAAMDRIFGYGLKYSDNFKHTHLGKMR